MATFIDSDEEELKQEEEVIEEQPVEEVVAEEQEPEPPQTEEDDEEDIPDKYKGKSKKDVVRMHQEIERAFGRQGSEIGELRRQFQQFQEERTVSKQAPDVEEEIDFLDDPNKFVDRNVERNIRNNPELQELRQLTQQLKAQQSLNKLHQAHPDFQKIIQDPKFGEWVQASKIRTKLLIQADKEYDFEAADELLSVWKERNQVVAQKKEEGKEQRKQAIKEAATGSASGSAEPRSGKIYRKTDVQELIQKDPERYYSDSYQAELLRARLEGRIR